MEGRGLDSEDVAHGAEVEVVLVGGLHPGLALLEALHGLPEQEVVATRRLPALPPLLNQPTLQSHHSF